MAATLASAHAGILTSEFEGMPRVVLETLAVGRPVVAMHLPQLESAIQDGVNGFLVGREGPSEQWAETLAQRFVEIRDAITARDMDPVQIAGAIAEFTPARQLARVFSYHREIQAARGMAIPRPAY